jgi:ABC-2 type transport system ATP-binding protein
MVEVIIEQAGYEQGKAIISNVNFSINPGEIIGLIGGNGAGKSTTIQCILQTIAHFEGTITIPAFGYVPERPILYTYYTLREHIHFLNQVATQDIWDQALALCTLFRLDNHLDEYPINFSKGMQQKVMLILAFAPNYDFYILDEPFMGLDPQAIRRLLLLIKEKREQGASILISTHALDTAERLCDRFLCMHEGALIAQGSMKEIALAGEATLLDVFDTLIEGTYNV